MLHDGIHAVITAIAFPPMCRIFGFMRSYSESHAQRKRGALTRASLSIHHIMLTIKCFCNFYGLVTPLDYRPVDDVP